MPETTSNSRRLFVTRLGVSFLFTLFIVAGCIASVQTGLTWDELREQQTFDVNRHAVEGLLTGDPFPVKVLRGYVDRHYGVGFHALAYPLQTLLRPYLERTIGIDTESAMLLAKHPAVFLMFALSVIVFYRLLRIFVRERIIALLFAAAYAGCPYLFGHSMLNVKDVPFMSVYLLCTYLSVKMAQHHLAGKTASFTSDFVALLFATTALASIRIPGNRDTMVARA